MSSNQARRSSSILIMSQAQTSQEIKVLLLTRSKHSRVWPNALVFPGGLSESGDEEIGLAFHLMQKGKLNLNETEDLPLNQDNSYLEWGMNEPIDWHRSLGTAIRETKEECGLDLSQEQDLPYKLIGPAQVIAHWLTPNLLKKRYDTYIWGIQLDHEYLGLEVDGVEISEAAWWGIAEALEAYESAEVDLPVPTLMILSELRFLQDQLGPKATTKRLLSTLATTPHSQAIQPIIVKGKDISLYLPGDHQYQTYAQQGEQAACIEREFWEGKMQRLKQKNIQLKSESKPIMRWYRVISS